MNASNFNITWSTLLYEIFTPISELWAGSEYGCAVNGSTELIDHRDMDTHNLPYRGIHKSRNPWYSQGFLIDKLKTLIQLNIFGNTGTWQI
jgi:hypothetical protein